MLSLSSTEFVEPPRTKFLGTPLYLGTRCRNNPFTHWGSTIHASKTNNENHLPTNSLCQTLGSTLSPNSTRLRLATNNAACKFPLHNLSVFIDLIIWSIITFTPHSFCGIAASCPPRHCKMLLAELAFVNFLTLHHKLEAILCPAGYRDLFCNELYYVDYKIIKTSHTEGTKTTPSGTIM